MKRYVVISAEGKAVNTIVWDGESEWSPPDGCTAALEGSAEADAAIAAAAPGEAEGE